MALQLVDINSIPPTSSSTPAPQNNATNTNTNVPQAAVAHALNSRTQPTAFSGPNADLLRFCIEHSDGPADDHARVIPQRDEKDYEFLRAAFAETQQESDIVRIRRFLTTLGDSAKDSADKAAALEELQYLIEDIDNANDMVKAGGIDVLLATLQSSDSELRYWAAWAIATAVHNNEFASQAALQKGALQSVATALRNESQDRSAAKIILALSPLIRASSVSLSTFVDSLDGLSSLARFLTTDDSSTSSGTQMKALFLIGYVLRESKSARERWSATPQLVQLISHSNADVREKALLALFALVSSDPDAQEGQGEGGEREEEKKALREQKVDKILEERLRALLVEGGGRSEALADEIKLLSSLLRTLRH